MTRIERINTNRSIFYLIIYYFLRVQKNMPAWQIVNCQSVNSKCIYPFNLFYPCSNLTFRTASITELIFEAKLIIWKEKQFTTDKNRPFVSCFFNKKLQFNIFVIQYLIKSDISHLAYRL